MSATPPDSGARRVIRALRKQAEATKREADRMRIIEIPADLAQRILAALVGQAAREECAKFPEAAKRLAALADELRKEMGRNG